MYISRSVVLIIIRSVVCSTLLVVRITRSVVRNFFVGCVFHLVSCVHFSVGCVHYSFCFRQLGLLTTLINKSSKYVCGCCLLLLYFFPVICHSALRDVTLVADTDILKKRLKDLQRLFLVLKPASSETDSGIYLPCFL